MPGDPSVEVILAERPRRAHRGEDAATRCMQLFVAGPSGAQRELLHPVATPRRMGVAVDEARDRALAAAVDLLDLAVQRAQVAHAPDGFDRTVAHEHETVLDHANVFQLGSTQRRTARPGRCDLREVTDEQAGGEQTRRAGHLR